MTADIRNELVILTLTIRSMKTNLEFRSDEKSHLWEVHGDSGERALSESLLTGWSVYSTPS
jgi:hypothetical protein